MEIKFIGTGSGKTSLQRNHTSLLLQCENNSLLIDSGDGITKALSVQGISFNFISSIILTHYHADHFSGIASLITQMKLSSRKTDLSIYTHDKLVRSLQSFLNTCYLFNETLGFNLYVNGFASGNDIIIDRNIKFRAEQNSHITNKHNLTSYPETAFISCSLLIASEGKTIVYTSDIGGGNDLYLFKDREIDIFISETTHVALDQIIFAFNTMNAKKLLLTHIDDDIVDTLKKKVREIDIPDKIIITEDGLTIKL